MAHVEAVGIAGAHLGNTVAAASGLAEPLGPEDQPVVLDLKFYIAADRLDVERVLAVPVRKIELARGGRRGQLVDQREKSGRFEPVGGKTQRIEHPCHPVAAFGQLGVGDAPGHGNAERQHEADMARVERRMRRARMPDEVVEAVGPRLGDGFVDPALLVARTEPGSDDRSDPGGSEVQDLQAGALRQALGEELPEDFAGAFVRPDQRGHFEHEALRMRVAIETRPFIVHAVGEPVREHVEREARPGMVGLPRIAEQAGEQRVARRGERTVHWLSPSGSPGERGWGTQPGEGRRPGAPVTGAGTPGCASGAWEGITRTSGSCRGRGLKTGAFCGSVGGGGVCASLPARPSARSTSPLERGACQLSAG